MSDHYASRETRQRVFEYLSSCADESGHVTASIQDVRGHLGLGLGTAWRALRGLQKEEAIFIVRRGTGGGYPSTYYVAS